MAPESAANYALVPVVVGFGIVAVRARRRDRLTLGLGWRHGGAVELGAGLGIASAAILILFGIERAAGIVHVTGVGGRTGTVLGYLIYLAILGTIEEAAFRGLLLPGLAVATRSRFAALAVSSLLVALPYLLSDGATPLTFVSAILAGFMYGSAYLRTGRIWTSVGMRIAWNFVQGPVLGFTVSGTVVGSDSIVHLATHAPSWLAGGGYGPEGGVIGIVIRIAVIAFGCVAVTGRNGPWRPRLRPDRPGVPVPHAHAAAPTD